MKKVQKILKTFGALNGDELKIQSKNLSLNMTFLRLQILHLLGVHYMYSDYRNVKGRELLREILYRRLTDEEIYRRVSVNNPEQLDNVKNRINYFREFMYNLDKARIVEMTNPQTKIKSHHLILQSVDEKYLQLGIARGEISDYFETFLVASNNIYFENSMINEPVTGIYRYDDNYNLIPFSFNPVKAKELKREYDKQKEEQSKTYADEQANDETLEKTFTDNIDEDEWDMEI